MLASDTNRKRFRLMMAATLALVLGLALPDGGAAAQEAVPPVVVALAGPMVGTSFSVGRQYQTGVTAAWEASGGSVLGRPVAVQAHDDACTDTLAASVARKLTEIRPAVVIGHSCSAATLAAAPIYADAGILEITPASTNPRVTEMGIGSIFRMIGRDDRQGVVAARRLAARWTGKRIGVISNANAYGRGLSEAAIGEMRRLGIEPALTVVFEPAQENYLAQIDQLTAAKVDVVYLVGGALDSAVVVRQARQSGATFDIIASDTLVSEVFAQAAGPLAQGVLFTFPPEPLGLPTAAAAVAAIRAKGVEPIGYTLLAYAAYEVWKAGVERAGQLDAVAVAAAIRQDAIPTILGSIRFDEKGDIISPGDPFVWYEWRDGKRIRITD